MAFSYQAIDASGNSVTDVLEASSAAEAADMLRDRGLFVTQLDRVDAETASTTGSSPRGWGRTRFRDVMLFTQQMSMLLRSGAQVVQALEAVEAQTQRPAWRDVVAAIRADVQEGRPLSAGLQQYPHLFSGVFVSMVTAGEASGVLGKSFERLSVLTRQQHEIRNRVMGAVSYPAVLLVLCAAVVVIMFSFILPRFAEMFEALDVELPVTTAVMIGASRWSQSHWVWLAVGAVSAITGLVMLVRSQTGRRFMSYISVRLPLFGPLVRNIILARICRTWGQLLESKVGLLEAVQLVRRGTTNYEFHGLLERLEQAITDGNSIGPELKRSWFVSKTYAGAVATGEESGRLTDSLLFVASCLEDENTEALGSLTRILEPLILAMMGLIVGTMAFSLFLPMFDMATATGG